MDAHAVAERIASTDGFLELPPDAHMRVAQILQSIGEMQARKAGEHVLDAGHLGFGSGYILLEGSVAVQATARELEVNAPALLGEMAQFKSSDTRTATVIAMTDAQLLSFDWDEFYVRCGRELGETARAVRAAVEDLVWRRFNHADMLQLPLFRGMEEGLKERICLPFAWLCEPRIYKEHDLLFKVGERCQFTGFLVVKGTVKLHIPSTKKDVLVSAPNLIGVMPKNDPSLLWTADATAQGDVETCVFNWQSFLGQVQKRLKPEDQQQMIEVMKTNAKEQLWH